MVQNLLVGVFLALHGLVHLWYVVLSQGWVAVEDAMGWNGHSWLLSGTLAEGTILSIATVVYVVATLGFVVSGVGYALQTDWRSPVLIGAAVLSTIMLVTMWDGQFDLLVEKGIVGVAINVAIVGALLFLVE
ncbi:MAG TPA: hypothetical protein VJ898_03730 [Natrialbaceae archaeon]|nr:hypothetical protein [Natrialbaceae archaeon]